MYKFLIVAYRFSLLKLCFTLNENTNPNRNPPEKEEERKMQKKQTKKRNTVSSTSDTLTLTQRKSYQYNKHQKQYKVRKFNITDI